LPTLQWRAIGRAQLVEVAQRRSFDEVLRVSEEIDDGHDFQPATVGGGDEPLEIAIRVGVGARDAGQAGVLDRIFKVQIKFLITPIRVARQLGEQPVESLHLPGEVPLKSAEHGGRSFSAERGG